MPLQIEVAESERFVANRVEANDCLFEQYDTGATKEFGLKSLGFFGRYEFVKALIAAIEGIRYDIPAVVLQRLSGEVQVGAFLKAVNPCPFG